jgi:hypothetical protein
MITLFLYQCIYVYIYTSVSVPVYVCLLFVLSRARASVFCVCVCVCVYECLGVCTLVCFEHVAVLLPASLTLSVSICTFVLLKRVGSQY